MSCLSVANRGRIAGHELQRRDPRLRRDNRGDDRRIALAVLRVVGDVDLLAGFVGLDKADELLAKWKVERGQIWLVGRPRKCPKCGSEAVDEV